MSSFRSRLLQEKIPGNIDAFVKGLPENLASAQEIISALLHGLDSKSNGFYPEIHIGWIVWLLAFGIKSADYKKTVSTCWELLEQIDVDFASIGGLEIGQDIVKRYIKTDRVDGCWKIEKGQIYWHKRRYAGAMKPADWVEICKLESLPCNLGKGDHLVKLYYFSALTFLLKAIVPESCFATGLSTPRLLALSFVNIAYSAMASAMDSKLPHEEIVKNGGRVDGEYYLHCTRNLIKKFDLWLLPKIEHLLK